MPRKRLRAFLDEVIGDADLRAHAERVSVVPDPGATPQAVPLPPAPYPAGAANRADPATSPAPLPSAPPQPSPALAADAAEAPGPSLEAPEVFPPPPWETAPAIPPTPPQDVALAVIAVAPPLPDGGNGSSLPDEPALAAVPDLTVVEREAPPGDGAAAVPVEAAEQPETDPALPLALARPLISVPAPDTEMSDLNPLAGLAQVFGSEPPSAGSGVALGPEVPEETPPAQDAILLDGPGHPAQAVRRRRRSVSLLPPLPSPADIPEDAAGRVAFIAVALPPEMTPAASPEAAATEPEAPAPITAVGTDTPLAGWLPVLALGVVLVLLFVIGVLVTR
jgi:hypothetical protein